MSRRRRAGRSFETVHFYETKAGHLVRLLETAADGSWAPFALAGLQARHVDGYISRRRAEKAHEATIAKELVTLRAALKLAVRAGLWHREVRWASVLLRGCAPPQASTAPVIVMPR